MVKKDLKPVQAKLEAEREELKRQLDDLERQSLGVAQSEASGESSFDEDYADSGTATFERERDLSIAQNLHELLGQVERALARVHAGTYGTCESCGRVIEAARLRAISHATLCLECKKREEGR